MWLATNDVSLRHLAGMTLAKTLGDMVPADESKLPEWARGLTPRQLLYVQEYLVDLSPRKAALRAGLSKTDTGASSVASNLMRTPEVRAAIDAALAEGVQARLRLRERVIQELSVLAFSDITRLIRVEGGQVWIDDTADLSEDERRAIKKIKQTEGKTTTLEVEFHDKVSALRVLNEVNGGSGRERDKGEEKGSVQVNSIDRKSVV